jgi:hypothetical protein
MARGMAFGTAWGLILTLGMGASAPACAETRGTHAQECPATAEINARADSSANGNATEGSQSEESSSQANKSLIDRLFAPFSSKDDPDGPINTDRPTFTPANTVVPKGRLQFESGFTFNNEPTAKSHSALYDFPELAMRYGLTKWLEFRTFWTGQTWIQTAFRPGGGFQQGGGLSDMEVGFKWQLFAGDAKRKWIPTTALITSIFAPTGGTSSVGSHTVQPYSNLIYGWSLTDKLTLAGSTGYLGMRQTGLGPGQAADSFERYHQSIVAFYSATKKTTLFYEWYILMFTNAADNRPMHFMDGGLLHHPTQNTQLDLRAGFGLSGRPDDFFTGAGFSIRF